MGRYVLNNHLHPNVLEAAVDVLEAMGCRVFVPQPALCCGRALYAEGMLKQAEKLLSDVMDHLGEGNTPIVGLAGCGNSLLGTAAI